MHLRSLKSTTLTHFSCSPNLPRASATWYTHAKHEQILKWLFWKACQLPSSSSIILSNTPVSIQADLQGEQTKSPSIWKRKILSGTVLSCSLLELYSVLLILSPTYSHWWNSTARITKYGLVWGLLLFYCHVWLFQQCSTCCVPEDHTFHLLIGQELLLSPVPQESQEKDDART